METQQLQQILKELRFSSGLSNEDQKKLADVSRVQEFLADSIIFNEGELPEDLYLVRSGRIELCMNVPARGCLPILTLEAGDLVGWSVLIEQGEMTATATAIKDTQVIAISADKLRELCEQDHDIGYQIMHRLAETLAQRLVATRLQVLDLFANSSQCSGVVKEAP